MTEVYFDNKTKSFVGKHQWNNHKCLTEEDYISRLEDEGDTIALIPDFPTPIEHWPRMQKSGDPVADAIELNQEYARWFD